MTEELTIIPGQRIRHAEFGEGVVVAAATNGFVRAFFGGGERQVPVVSITPILGRSEQVVRNVGSGERRNRRAWLAYQAHALPLIESAAALTSAKIDLLPHQVVLTHRIATASPRRYLIADEVGLGKTIESALILRELASRGELNRALMVVPAGLVNNWHRELNEVFNLDFEVFGSQGDVTDRKSNAFVKHDRLIASVDTLKRKPRVKRLMDAPLWDLVIFDEAQHLTASKSGGKLKKTDNYRLAESLRSHCRDLILLSATPHQGDHYRFYMLMQLLDPTLFTSPDDMIENRHRLNSIIFRRTKADACRPDGSTLFARRWVHTESFVMSEVEREFYNDLHVYLMDGFALAKQQGNKGRALGFVMTIFQKIAASSFAAVHRTLRRRLIALTVQEGLMHDSKLDIDARDAAFAEARQLIQREFHLTEDRLGQIEAERVLADLKRRIVKKMDDDDLAMLSSEYSSETETTASEDSAIIAVELALPEERQRIRDLLTKFPPETETKVKNLINALGTLWQQDSSERVVIFATYLGSVEMLGEEIERAYPGQGVVVLKGGDHGTKLSAEKRFKQPNGPRVMICTAAGREGINLQHARVLFNFDLPWNPMDLEQRIGRIHRYGQKHTAQVYNLVLSDTIEGKIFLLLDDKLKEIAKALGKVDEHGEVAEDLRSQILGQLSERLSYESLYAQAVSDPELKRTRLELEQALSNASEARNVVYELFQDLDGFSLNDYQPFSDTSEGMDEIVRFVRTAAEDEGKAFRPEANGVFVVTTPDNGDPLRFTTDRDSSIEAENIDLLGLDHPNVVQYMQRFRSLPDEQIGIRVRSDDGRTGVLSIWHVTTQGERSETRNQMLSLAVNGEGQRIPSWEKQVDRLFQFSPASSNSEPQIDLLTELLEPMIHRELIHRGFLAENRGYDARLVGWVEVV
ncbi:RNA polymerase-associated protein RapA [Polystyrenella longa]|uniref:RNA polymerase-associated protein RapA n=1 Tax=Polystyrenella longa TaxID=2528007 RepID=A0A518CMP3_9PLAN|nr:SNF2-related protein [Polystyrenella longa]QDU80495.1 RNA polymerase-associated protein RapA [Polystyrenella longa]